MKSSRPRPYGITISSLLLIGVTTSAAHANSLYVGTSIGKTDLLDEYFEGGGSLKSFAGFEINRNLAIEAGVYGLISAEGEETYFGVEEGNITAVSVTAVVKQPLTPQLEIFGKLGMANTEVEMKNIKVSPYSVIDYTASDKALMYGIGANLSYSPNWAIRVEHERTNLGDENYGISSLGVMYKTF